MGSSRGALLKESTILRSSLEKRLSLVRKRSINCARDPSRQPDGGDFAYNQRVLCLPKDEVLAGRIGDGGDFLVRYATTRQMIVRGGNPHGIRSRLRILISPGDGRKGPNPHRRREYEEKQPFHEAPLSRDGAQELKRCGGEAKSPQPNSVSGRPISREAAKLTFNARDRVLKQAGRRHSRPRDV